VVSDDTLINSFAYDEYGSVSVLAGDRTIRDGYGFSAEWFDSYLGLLYYNYRHYNPLVGRWVCRDPIGEMGGVNLYQAFDNNPIMAVDILGYASHLDCEKQKSNWEKLLDENSKSSLRMLWNRMSKNKECTIPPIECKCCDGDKRKYGGYWNSADSKITICENNLPKENIWTTFGSILSHELVHAAQSLCFKWNNSDCRTSVCREIQAYSIQFGIPLNTRKNRSEIKKGVLFSSRCACAKEVVPNWDKDKNCDENISGHEDAVARRIKTEFDALYSSCVHRVAKPSVLAK
jgi:RHS repeat-associated protein